MVRLRKAITAAAEKLSPTACQIGLLRVLITTVTPTAGALVAVGADKRL